MNEDGMEDDMSLAEYEYFCEQQALPPHKRDGYAEMVYERADMERKRIREES